jgi:hypothetical protein
MINLNKYLYLFLFVLISSLAFTTLNHRKEIKGLEIKVSGKSIEIDSLFSTIDSLVLELEQYNVERKIRQYTSDFLNLLDAIIRVESSDNDSAYHKGEDAVGCLQIRQCMVDDVNRILNRKKSTIRYTYDDRWSRDKSIEMFDVYRLHYGLVTAEEISRCWNGGPRGSNKPTTVYYWNKVKSELDETNS